MKHSNDPRRFDVVRCSAAVLAAVLLQACAVEVRNVQAARDVARLSNPSGSVYAGWRVFQDKCASCHGADASGQTGSRDLLPSVREMGPRRFVALVLNRYDLDAAIDGPAKDTPARAAWIDAVVQRKEGALTMPVWQGEPSVSAHVMDLYAYVAARADGSQGRGRPAR